MGKTRLAPGYRFHPTDVELVRYYLKRKVMGKTLPADTIAELDIYKFEPSDLPDKSYTKSGDLKWHFFCPREKKYSTGVRANRATGCGYWKTTGKERAVLCNGEVVGKIRTLVYHFGKSPRGERTDWVMHEYSLEDNELKQQNVPQDTYVLCVVFKKDGPGPRNGAQYGAPFKEEDWSEEEHLTTVPAISNPTTLHWPNEETSLVVAPSHDPIKDCFGGMIPESCASDFLPATATTSELPRLNDAASTPMSKPPPLIDPSCTASLAQTLHAPNNDDDIYSMLDHFVDEDEYLRFCEPNNSEVRHDPNVSAPPICIGEEIIFDELPDFMNMHNNSMLRTSSYDLIENSELYLNLQEFTTLLAPPQTQTRNVSESYFTAPVAPPPNGNVTYLPAPLAPPQIGKTMGGEADMK